MTDRTTSPTSSVPAAYRSLLPEGGPMNWLRGEIDRLFDDFGQPGRSLFNFPVRTMAPVPALELRDGGKEYHLTAELPGLTDKDIDVEVAEGVLTISGEKSEEKESKDQGYLLSERRYGSFARKIALPADAKPDAIKAQFKDGVLTLTIGKDETSPVRTRKIAINH